MTKTINLIAAAAVLVTGVAFVPAPASAQSSGQAEIVVFGTDPCPRSTDDEIVICRRYPESERFRLAPQLRPSGPRQVRESWSKRSEEYKTLGATGIGSCSAVGPGGSEGCLLQDINRAVKERQESTDADTAPER